MQRIFSLTLLPATWDNHHAWDTLRSTRPSGVLRPVDRLQGKDPERVQGEVLRVVLPIVLVLPILLAVIQRVELVLSFLI